jgi:hypothetical protein
MAKGKKAGIEKLGISALAGGAVAAVLNILLLWLARGAGYEPMAKSGGMLFPEPISAMQVVVSCFIPAIGASVLVWALRRWTRNPAKIFYSSAMIFLVLSMAGPAMVPVNRLATRFILGAMHLVAAGAIIGSLQRMGGLKK